MLSRIKALKDNIVAYHNDIDKNVADILLHSERIVVDLNLEQLEVYGQDRFGVEIDDYDPYSQTTLDLKALKGKSSVVTLSDSYDFHKGFILIIGKDFFDITSKDSKTKVITSRYTKAIGLNPENLDYVIWHIIYPEMKKKLKNYINGDRK